MKKLLKTIAILTLIVLWFQAAGHTALAATWEDMGTFRISHYCNCSRCCGKYAGGPTASGAMPERYRTIAVDTSVIPMGATVYIDGYGFRVAEDTGVYGQKIDVFCPDHNLCLAMGIKYRNVWIVKGEIEKND